MAIPSQKARGVSCQSATPADRQPDQDQDLVQVRTGQARQLGQGELPHTASSGRTRPSTSRLACSRRHELEELGQHIDRRHVGHGRHDVLGDLVDVRHVGDDRGPASSSRYLPLAWSFR